MSGRRQTYRIEVSPDLYGQLVREAKAARPATTLRAVAEMLLWDQLAEVAAHRVRAAGQATQVPGPQTVEANPVKRYCPCGKCGLDPAKWSENCKQEAYS